ncbi:small heat shock protein IbpA [Teredinibacter turnerae T7901]|uniref:Small heat shock protein IbpA n=1 Tax=Teredinibacter turnerae (strain ATCC 39867 / T7901) TaxID=377629 RepID=C5BTI2_TERTT|nr:Hsp20 family protein [Teredinibacter turnerae]ACR12769.1 small heat shock protein IbpA [Teredinibacter turnerae T7901]
MRNIDFTPLYRSAIGFDRMANMLDAISRSEQSQPSYPPYNIELTGEDKYRISMAVAGFSEQELSIETKENTLSVTGKKSTDGQAERKFLHQGIAARNFERRFQLADYVIVTGASLENGLLHVELVREIPDAMKPRTISISGNRKQEVIDQHASGSQSETVIEPSHNQPAQHKVA